MPSLWIRMQYIFVYSYPEKPIGAEAVSHLPTYRRIFISFQSRKWWANVFWLFLFLCRICSAYNLMPCTFNSTCVYKVLYYHCATAARKKWELPQFQEVAGRTRCSTNPAKSMDSASVQQVWNHGPSINHISSKMENGSCNRISSKFPLFFSFAETLYALSLHWFCTTLTAGMDSV